MKPAVTIAIALFICFTTSCSKTEALVDFTVEDEMLLGEKLAEALINDESYTIIPSEGNPIPYGYVESRLSEILASDSLVNADFSWTITLLENDSRTAFVLPGGYIYVNSGMIFYLENEDQFAGMIAHLVAHADKSHITERLFFEYGVNGLKNIANGSDEEMLLSILDDLDTHDQFLTYNRAHEIEADFHSVGLLSGSDQSCISAALFFNRTLNVQPERQAAFLGAHNGAETRVEDIEAVAGERGCDTTVDSGSSSRYQSFRNSLP
ncbi:Peptidase family M48 [Ekhidna lutea]|uniref:Peptidase family M48 n=1 Tax=Ekhidna lutea TaxID=447679 RepID=A0A239L7U6_EKHLU|nr:M48 family metalloprotease [Ekhidna lutea]SNT26531.1 Peptidase family M48 [Ekhidna lutea]